MSLALPLFWFIACGAPQTDTNSPTAVPMPIWDYTTDALFDAPFPSDIRRSENGDIDLSTFPNPYKLSLIDDYIDVLNTLDGFATTSPLYIPFDNPIDESLLPDPEQSTSSSATVQLINIDQSSDDWATRIPVLALFTPDAKTYQPANLLSVTPLFGHPLDPHTQYALIISTDLADQNPSFAALLDNTHHDHQHLLTLIDALPQVGLTKDDIAVAAVFTTTDPLKEMAAISDQIKNDTDPVDLSQELTARTEYSDYTTYTGQYTGPLYQHGERPYADTGGEFRFHENGTPILHGTESIRIGVSVPTDAKEPKNGWPIVVYAHGTGGNYLTFCNSTSQREPAAVLGRSGFVGISFDQPLHGTRANATTDSSLHTYNFQNPQAGRSNHRQGAIDFIYLINGLYSLGATWTTDTGQTIRIDPTQISLMGHSQGGTTGALALPFLGQEIRSAVLSGAGGGLAITIIERKDPLDIEVLLGVLLGLQPDEVLSEQHPVVGLTQAIIEVSDPLNYAPYWFSKDGYWAGAGPVPTIAFSGVTDTYTPYRSTVAMTAAAMMPQITPIHAESTAHQLAGLDPSEMPASNNTLTSNGVTITAGFAAYPYGDHYVIFNDNNAVNQYMSLLNSARSGAPTISATAPK